jgi:hypothetical protein
MAQPQQQPPNIPNMNIAITGMTTEGNVLAQGLQAYTAHQQALCQELSRFGNFPVAQIQQQLAAIQTTLQTSINLSSAR